MLVDLIDTNNTLDENLVNKWHSVGPLLETKYILKTITINGAIGLKYKNDFDGLMTEVGISKEFFYPHMLVNNILSSRDYDGTMFQMKILNSQTLNGYLELFQA